MVDPTTVPPVVFSFTTWTQGAGGAGGFPEFIPVGATLGQAYFNRATGGIVGNSTTNPAFNDGNLPYQIYLATSHVAWLNCPRDANGNPAAAGQPASPLVGRISSAAEGSVNVQTEWPLDGSSSSMEKYLAQTKYGAELWAALGPYRTAQIAPRPTVVVAGRFRNNFFPGWGWGRGPWC